MPTVTVAFSPVAAEVRTARLVGVALGRRSGFPEELIDELRLAIGEACSRAVAVHRRASSKEPVRVRFTEDDRGFEVRVDDIGDADAVVSASAEELGAIAGRLEALGPDADAGSSAGLATVDLDGRPPLPAGIGLAVIAGLVDELAVHPLPGGGTSVVLRWTR